MFEKYACIYAIKFNEIYFSVFDYTTVLGEFELQIPNTCWDTCINIIHM